MPFAWESDGRCRCASGFRLGIDREVQVCNAVRLGIGREVQVCKWVPLANRWGDTGVSSCLIRLPIGRTSFVFSLRLFGTKRNNWGASLQSTSLFVKFAGQRSVEARCALRCGRDIPSLLM